MRYDKCLHAFKKFVVPHGDHCETIDREQSTTSCAYSFLWSSVSVMYFEWAFNAASSSNNNPKGLGSRLLRFAIPPLHLFVISMVSFYVISTRKSSRLCGHGQMKFWRVPCMDLGWLVFEVASTITFSFFIDSLTHATFFLSFVWSSSIFCLFHILPSPGGMLEVLNDHSKSRSSQGCFI